MFQSVIAPRTHYAAIVWHQPRHDGSTASSTHALKLTTTERIAMKAILGCCRTTPTAAMEIESGLQPSWNRLQTKVLLATTRMQSLSEKHHIKKWLANAMRTRTAKTRHRSNFENILQQFLYMAQRLETIEPYIRPPWWTPITKLHAAATKNNATDLHDELQRLAASRRDTMTIYIDRSGIDGKIGAAAYNASSKEINHQHLGDETQYNVYVAELTGIHMAVTQWERSEYPICRIFIDRQAAGTSINQPRTQSGQSIIKAVVNLINDIRAQHPHKWLQLVWVPGQHGVEGNERVDMEAKRAATDPTLSHPFNHSPLKSF